MNCIPKKDERFTDKQSVADVHTCDRSLSALWWTVEQG